MPTIPLWMYAIVWGEIVVSNFCVHTEIIVRVVVVYCDYIIVVPVIGFPDIEEFCSARAICQCSRGPHPNRIHHERLSPDRRSTTSKS